MYSKINEYDYGIQSLKPIFDETRVQLGLDLSANGNFTFNVKENSLNENIKIYLLDNETGVEIEINANRNYTFEASAGSSERFTLIFRKMGLPTELENIANNENYLVYTNKTTLFVKTTNKEKIEVSVTDLLGRTLKQQYLRNSETIELPEANQVYIVRIKNEQNEISTYKVISK